MAEPKDVPKETDGALLRAVLDASINGVMLFSSVRDDDGEIIDFRWLLSNRSACDLVGRAEDELRGRRLRDVMPGNVEDGLFARYVEVVERREPVSFVHHYAHPEEGVHASFRIHAAPQNDGFVVTFVDVSAEYAAQDELRRQQAYLHLIVENATDMVSLHSRDGTYEYVTPSCRRLFGWDPEQLIGTCAYDYFHLDDLETIAASHRSVNRESEREAFARYRIRKPDGTYTWFETTSKTIAEDGRIICVSRDVSKQVEIEGALETLATRDPLTELYNRRALMTRFETELARMRRHERPLSVLVLDVDHFKQVNDRWGHDAGDRALRALARLLEHSVRETDLVARTGGEEFTILLPETPGHGAVRLAERIREGLLNVRIHAEQVDFGLTVSIGVAEATGHADPTAVLKAADAALYGAKRTGRDRVLLAPPAQPRRDDAQPRPSGVTRTRAATDAALA